MRRRDHLIVTADDFGLSTEVNEAVEIAHCDGILSAASLMVGAPAAAEAVDRAKRLPGLRVGLHLVLVDGEPILPRARIPNLVGRDGRLRRDMTKLSFELAVRPTVRRQLAMEIGAQFEAFRVTGLILDHVNAHKHFHLHPIVASLVLSIGRRFGLRALRLPREPARVIWEAGGYAAPFTIEALMAGRLKRAIARTGVVTSDAVLGLRWSGAMTTERLAGLLRARPSGIVEIYTHPAVSDDFAGCASGYRYRDELTALCSPRCRELLNGRDRPRGYADIESVIDEPRPASITVTRPA